MNKKRLALYLILVWILPWFLHPADAQKANKIDYKDKILPVKRVAQETNFWCWAASGEMIISYLKKEPISQCDLVKEELYRCDCCQKPTPDDCKKFDWPNLSKYGYHKRFYGLNWAELVEQIDNCKPVGFSWAWKRPPKFNDKLSSGHYMVVRGYIKINGARMVVVNDPAPRHPEKSKGGSVKIISYRDYLAFEPRYTHWFDHYYDPSKNRLDGPTYLPKEYTRKAMESAAHDGIDEEEAMRKSLEYLKQLPPGLLEALGFKPAKIVENAYLREPLYAFIVKLDNLKNFSKDRKAASILESLWDKEFIYPVYVGQEPISSVTIRKRKNKWNVAVIGGGKISRLESERKKHAAEEKIRPSSYFIVEVPAMYATFLGYFSGESSNPKSKLYLLSKHRHPGLIGEYTVLGEEHREAEEAEDVFMQLKGEVEKYEKGFDPSASEKKIKR